MNLNVSEWKEFYLKNLYDIQMGNGFDKNKLDEENPEINLVSRVSYNNGVDVKVGYVHPVKPFDAGLVTVALGGSYLGSCFVQEEPFYTGQNVAVMKSKFDDMTHIVNIFISGLVRFECTTKYYAFGRELNTHIKTDFTINLPIQHNADGTPYIDPNHIYSEEGYVPDWQFMEDYMKSLHHKPLTTKSTVGNGLALKTDEWKEFRVGDLFDLKPTKGKDSTELLDGNDIAYIGAKKEMNGFMMRCQLNGFEEWVSDGNCIVFICLGAGSAGYATYQKDDFIGMSGKTICGYNKNLNPIIGNFLVTILDCERPKYSFGRSWTGDRLKNTIIKLPIQHNPDGTPYIDPNHTYSEDGYVPDWQFMEDYMKALPYGDRL